MKLTFKESTEREIEVTFPLAFKNGSAYYYIPNENYGLAVYTSSNSISNNSPSILLNYYSPENICTKEEVEKAFDKVVSNLKKNFLTILLEML